MPNTPDTQKEEIFAIQNIFGKPPGWLVYWGITCAFVFLVVCLGIAAFVKYPDKLAMPAKLFTQNPPIEIISKMNAEIDSIYISKIKGQPTGMMFYSPSDLPWMRMTSGG